MTTPPSVPSSRVRRGRGREGFTLIEALFATTLLTMIFGAAFGVVISGTHTVESGVLETRLQSRSRDVLTRIARDVRSSSIEPMVDPLVLRFRKFHGTYGDNLDAFDFDNAEIQWDEIPMSLYRLDLAPGELDNGKDDNKDGRIDEGILSLEQGGLTTVIASDVADGGFYWELVTPRKLVLRITLEVTNRTREGANNIKAKGETTVFLRN